MLSDRSASHLWLTPSEASSPGAPLNVPVFFFFKPALFPRVFLTGELHQLARRFLLCHSNLSLYVDSVEALLNPSLNNSQLLEPLRATG